MPTNFKRVHINASSMMHVTYACPSQGLPYKGQDGQMYYRVNGRAYQHTTNKFVGTFFPDPSLQWWTLIYNWDKNLMYCLRNIVPNTCKYAYVCFLTRLVQVGFLSRKVKFMHAVRGEGYIACAQCSMPKRLRVPVNQSVNLHMLICMFAHTHTYPYLHVAIAHTYPNIHIAMAYAGKPMSKYVHVYVYAWMHVYAHLCLQPPLSFIRVCLCGCM